MTLKEYGEYLFATMPKKLKRRPDIAKMSPEQLAREALAAHPEKRHLISEVHGKIYDVAHQPKIGSGFFAETIDASRAAKIRNDAAEVEALHKAHLAAKASSEGIPLEAVAPLTIMSHEVTEKIRLAEAQAKIQNELTWKERQQALEALRLADLDQHRTLDSIREQLQNLRRQRYKAAQSDDPEELKAQILEDFDTQIAILEKDLHGRGTRFFVSDEEGEDVSGVHPDTRQPKKSWRGNAARR